MPSRQGMHVKRSRPRVAKIGLVLAICVLAALWLWIGDWMEQQAEPLNSKTPQPAMSDQGQYGSQPNQIAPGVQNAEQHQIEQLPDPDQFTISFDVVQVVEQSQGFAVQLSVRNLSPDPVANLHIEGQLYAGSDRLERSVGQLEAVPSGGERRVSLFFVNDPREHELRLLAKDLLNPQTDVSQTAALYVGSSAR